MRRVFVSMLIAATCMFALIVGTPQSIVAAPDGKTIYARADVIKNGRGKMPAQKTLSDAEIAELIKFIRSLK